MRWRLPWHELDGGVPAPGCAEANNVLPRPGGRVLGRVRLVDRVPNPLAANTNGTNSDLALSDGNGSHRILEQRSVPTGRFERPRTREYPALHNDWPYANEPMLRAKAGAHAEYLALVDRLHDAWRESVCHDRTLQLVLR